MSRSNKGGSGSTSPIKRYVNYSGSTGKFNYWDKEKGEKGEKVHVDTLDFTVLDIKGSISGFNESLGARISSNMVTSTAKEPLKVVCYVNGKGLVQSEGFYKEIKDEVKGYGGKFTTNVLALGNVGNGEELLSIQLSGGALGNWIDYGKELEGGDVYAHRIALKRGILSKRVKGNSVPVTKKEETDLEAAFKENPRHRGPIWFYTVAIDSSDLTEEQEKEADIQDTKLQEFFNSKVETSLEAPSEEVTTAAKIAEADDSDDDEGPDDLPF